MNQPKHQIAGVICAAIQEAIDIVHQSCLEAGWWTNLKTGEPLNRNKGEMIALMHSELCECLEGVRKSTQDDHLPHRRAEEVELADVVIRIFDYAGGFGLDLPGAIAEKFAYNQSRADHKIENRMKPGGKSI